MLGGQRTDYENIRPAFTGPNVHDHRGQLWYKLFHVNTQNSETINNDSNDRKSFFLNAKNYDGRTEASDGYISHGISQFIVDYGAWINHVNSKPDSEDVKSLKKSIEAVGNTNNLYSGFNIENDTVRVNVNTLKDRLPTLGEGWKGLEKMSGDKLTLKDGVDQDYLKELFNEWATSGTQGQLGGGVHSFKAPYKTVAELGNDDIKFDAFLIGGEQTIKAFFSKDQKTDSEVEDTKFEEVFGEAGNKDAQVVTRNNKGQLLSNGEVAENKPGVDACDILKGMNAQCKPVGNCLKDGKKVLAECSPTDLQAVQVKPNTDAKKEVDKMNPQAAFDILKGFGFSAQRRHDPIANRELLKVQPVSEWAESSKDKDGASLADNKYAGLRAYLELVVAFVDQHPAILNEDYREGPVALPASGDPFGLSLPLGKKRRETNMDDFRDQISRRNRYIETMVNGLVGMPLKLRLYGGGVRTVPAPSLVDRRMARVPRLSKTLRQIYKYYRTRLANQNKTLSKSTESKIEQHLESLAKEEAKVTRVIKFVEAYSLLSDAMADFSTRTGITSDTLKKMYEKYEKHRNAVTRKSNNLVDIIETLVHATKDQESSGSNNIPL